MGEASRRSRKKAWGMSEWRRRVSIPVPLACKASALPFELHPQMARGAREARTLDLRISRSYETYALANCATAPMLTPPHAYPHSYPAPAPHQTHPPPLFAPLPSSALALALPPSTLSNPAPRAASRPPGGSKALEIPATVMSGLCTLLPPFPPSPTRFAPQCPRPSPTALRSILSAHLAPTSLFSRNHRLRNLSLSWA